MEGTQPLISIIRRILWISFAIATLAGCATAPLRPTESKSTSAVNSRYIVYTRSGGITGKTSTWTIYADGRIQANNSLTYTTTSQETTALFSQIPLAAFIKQSTAPQPKTCPDCTTATLEYHEGEQIYKVDLVLESADTANPARAWVEMIDGFLAKASNK